MRIEIPNTVPEKTEMAGFEELVFNFSNMKSWMSVNFNGRNITQYGDIYANYNLLTADEQTGIKKFMKLNVVEIYNKAMGTEFTWDQVPDKLFELSPVTPVV